MDDRGPGAGPNDEVGIVDIIAAIVREVLVENI